MEHEEGSQPDWENYQWEARDCTRFPYFMTDFKNKTFKYVFENHPEYVEFMLKVTKATGLFKAFIEYCRIRQQSN
jgi:hypothetical protein